MLLQSLNKSLGDPDKRVRWLDFSENTQSKSHVANSVNTLKSFDEFERLKADEVFFNYCFKGAKCYGLITEMKAIDISIVIFPVVLMNALRTAKQ